MHTGREVGWGRNARIHADALPERHGYTHTHTHAYEYSHPAHTLSEARACRSDRRTQQCCIDFLQFFDEMSYSDSLPRCYFA